MLRCSRVALLAAAGFGLVASIALAQSPTRARTDAGREVILRSDGTWTFADPPPAVQPSAASPPALPPQQPGVRPLATPPAPPSTAPSVRSLVTPPSAPQVPATPAPVRSAAPTVTPGAGQPPPALQPPAPTPPSPSATRPAPIPPVAPVRPVPPLPVAQPAAQSAGQLPAIQRPRSATATLNTSRGGFRIWYNPAVWQPAPATADGRVEFRQNSGQAVIVVIPEGTPLPLVALRTAAVENARRSAPDARVVAEQTRRIGNRDVLLLQVNATLTAGNLPVTYYGHYFGDPRGSIQVVGAVAQADFDRLRPQIQDFLDGLDLNRP